MIALRTSQPILLLIASLLLSASGGFTSFPTQKMLSTMRLRQGMRLDYGSTEGGPAKNANSIDVESMQSNMMEIHDSGVNLTYEWRLKQLKLLHRLVKENTEDFRRALAMDLGREGTEAVCIETKPLAKDIEYTIYNLRSWMKPQPVPSPMVMIPALSYLERKPLCSPGVLIIGPFNYPVRLILQPLLGALAAGNPAVVKPSEHSPNVANLLKKLLEQYYTESGVVQVVLGGPSETTALLEKRWGKVFFTGSMRVGKIVQRACAETMTPTIMELGGKCPAVIDETVAKSAIETAATRIVFAKCLNSGQTCIAPDTLFVHENHVPAMCSALQRAIEMQFGKNPKTGELSRIINTSNTKRIIGLLEDAEKLGTKVICGGSKLCDTDTKYVAPTFLLDPPKEAKILEEEVFGPAMAIIPFSSREEGIRRIRDLPGEPLQLYVFTPNSTVFKEYTDKCKASGAFRNDVIMQGSSHHLPLGGIGTSGHGNYVGKYSFDAFTHIYAVAHRPLMNLYFLDTIRCHPFRGIKGRLLETLGFLPPDVPVLHSHKLLFCIGAATFLYASPNVTNYVKEGVVFLLEKALSALKT